MQNEDQYHDIRRKAVALEYNKTDIAPKVIAKGQGKIADKIVEVAKQADVPITEDKDTVESLVSLDIGEYIPRELYEVVSSILVFVDDMDRIKSKVYK